MRLSLIALAVCFVAACYAADSPGVSSSNKKFQSSAAVKGQANANGGIARGRPVGFTNLTGKKGRGLGVAGGRKNAAKMAYKSRNSQTGKAFKTPDNRSFQSNAEGANGAMGIMEEGQELNAQMRSTGKKGRGRGLSTWDRRDKDAKYRSSKVNADLKSDTTTKERQSGTIEVDKAPKGPFRYQVVCPPGASAGRGECNEELVDRNGKVHKCTVTDGQSNCNVNNGRGVGASTNRDGETQVTFKGIRFSKADCVETASKESYNCKVSKGLLASSVSKIEAKRGPECYTSRPNGKEVKIENVKYIAEPGSGGDFEQNAHDCFTMRGTLKFTGFSRTEMKGIVSKLALQFHGMVNPVGKLTCHDTQVCQAKNKDKRGRPVNTDCYYCNLCDKSKYRGKASLMGGFDQADLEKACEQDTVSRQDFAVKFCPPKDVDGNVCPNFDRSVQSEYRKRKGDIDSRIEVYLRDAPAKSLEEFKRDFARLNRFQLIKYQIAAAAGKVTTNVDKNAVLEAYMAEETDKGELVGCAIYTSGFGIGNSGQSVGIDAAYTAFQTAKGNSAALFRPPSDCDKLQREKAALYGV